MFLSLLPKMRQCIASVVDETGRGRAKMIGDLLVVVLPILVIIFLLSIALRFFTRADDGHKTQPYKLKRYLFTRAERSFLGVIEQVLGDDFRVYGKVRLADIFSVAVRGSAYRSALNRIQSKHIDFVICRKDDISIQCLIELNDKSHDRADRQKRDQFLREVCADTGIKLIEVPAQRTYLPEQIATLLAPYSRTSQAQN